MDTDKSKFDWLNNEISVIRSQRFHIFEPVSSEECKYAVDSNIPLHVIQFSEFLEEYGYARLFTDHSDAPTVSVYPLKSFRRHVCKDGSVYVGFGFRSYQSVYFNESLILKNELSPVFTVNAKQGKIVAPTFSEWLFDACQWAKSKYSEKQWAAILKGPKPFTNVEQGISEATEKFEFKLIGFHEDGDAFIEVKNNSALTLPYLSIGVKDKSDAVLIGGAWLDVSKIEPNQKSVIKRDCYKDRISQSELLLFRKPKPIPEKREAYWEFKTVPAKI